MKPTQKNCRSDTLEAIAALAEQLELSKYPFDRAGSILPPVGFVRDFYNPDPPRDAYPALPADLKERATRDWLPIPHYLNRERYNENDDYGYWLFGLEDFIKVSAAADSLGIRGGKYYDFGGSTGRVFRHFFCQDFKSAGRFQRFLQPTKKWEVWSSDLNINLFRWNQLYMPQGICVFLNMNRPPLPFTDHAISLLTAFSVFTHIDHLEVPWLLELRRILRPGGLAYITIHDEEYWDVKRESMTNLLQSLPEGSQLNLASPLANDRIAFHYDDSSHYGCHVFHRQDYIRRQWGRFFDIVDVKPKNHAQQCVVQLTYT